MGLAWGGDISLFLVKKKIQRESPWFKENVKRQEAKFIVDEGVSRESVVIFTESAGKAMFYEMMRQLNTAKQRPQNVSGSV